jgi:hypothetical protein
MQLLKEKCDPGVATDRSLPTSAYLVTYKLEGKDTYDLVVAGRAVDIFDEYYDKYKKDFVTFRQASGTVNPSLWGYQSKSKPKKKRRSPDS